jgi:hypothetical protein
MMEYWVKMKNMLSSFPAFQYAIIPVFHGLGNEDRSWDGW